MNIHNAIFEYFTEATAIIKLIWIVSFFFISLILFLIFYLSYLRKNLRKQGRIVKLYEKKYEAYLLNYLYSEDEVDNKDFTSQQQLIINQLRLATQDPFIRKIVISLLVKVQNEISGEISAAVEKLYIEIKLVDIAMARLKSKKWYVIAKGIRELNQFNVKKAYDEIIVHVNHPRREVRKEMQLYLVNVFYFEGLHFLDQLELQLSEWDQIQLLGVLQRFENQDISDISSWLKSTNNSVIIFALKLAEIYNQIESKEEILQLLNHESETIRVEAIRVLTCLNITEAKEILKQDFEKRTQEEQISFFMMIKNLYDKNDESFILDHVHSDIFEIKVESLQILKILNKDKFDSIKNETADPDFIKIVNFIENN